MKKIIIGIVVIGIMIFINSDNKQPAKKYSNNNYSPKIELLESNSFDGYDWAEENYVTDFSDCDDEFGANTEAEDGCNDYVQENKYQETPSFQGYECTEDCSGHDAGYNWAEEKGIDNIDDCGGNSDSFIEGCQTYVEEYGY